MKIEIGDNLTSILMVLAVYSPFILILMIGLIYAIAFTFMVK